MLSGWTGEWDRGGEGELESALFDKLRGIKDSPQGHGGAQRKLHQHWGKTRESETNKKNYHAFLRDKILKLQGKSFPQARDVHPTLTEKIHSYRIAASE